MTTFQRIYEHVIAKAPQLAPRNTHIIHEWIAQGYDVEKDIIIAIDETLKRGSLTIFSFGFFTPNIKRKHEMRVKTDNKPIQHTKDESEVIRAKNIKWHKVKGLLSTRLGHQDFEWLAKYEQQHGEVQI